MICIIDYSLGNVISIKNAITRIGYGCIISSKISEIRSSKILILPGVGSLKEKNNIRNMFGISAYV